MEGIETSFDLAQQQRIWRKTAPVSDLSPNTVSSRVLKKIWESVLPNEPSPFYDTEPADPKFTGHEGPVPFIGGAQINKIERKLARLNDHDLDEERGVDSDCSDLSEIMSNFSLEDREDHRQPRPQTPASSTLIQSHRRAIYQEDSRPSHLRPATPLDARRYSRARMHRDRITRILKSSSGSKTTINVREPSFPEESSRRSRHPCRKERVTHSVHYGPDYYRPHYPRSDYWRPSAIRSRSSSSLSRARGGSRIQSTSFRLRQESHSKRYQPDLDYGDSTEMKTQKNPFPRRDDRAYQSQANGNTRTHHAGDSSVTQADAVVDPMEICDEESSSTRMEEDRKIVLPMRPRF